MQLRRDAKWWGWGNPAVAPTLDERALGVLRERIGELEAWPLARSLGEFELPAAEALPAALVATVGEENVFVDDEDRLRHAAGRGYVDLARLRNGALEAAPDAVLMPRAAAALQRVLEICAAEGVAVVPFGGGTSVVGGVEPVRGGDGRVLRSRSGDRAGAGAGSWPAGDHPRLRRGGDRRDAGALGAARPQQAVLRRLPRPAQAPRRRPDDRRLRGRRGACRAQARAHGPRPARRRRCLPRPARRPVLGARPLQRSLPAP